MRLTLVQGHALAVLSMFIWKLVLLLASMKSLFVWLVALRFFINKNVSILNQLESCFVLSLLLNKSKGSVPEGI